MEAYFERFTLEITPEHAEIGSHPGACDEDIAYLLTLDEIQSQFDAISPELIAAELKEYGAWDEIELSDTESNKGRILWIACGNAKMQSLLPPLTHRPPIEEPDDTGGSQPETRHPVFED